MGRALHVSRSLPPIISSARIVNSIEKPDCISLLTTESGLSSCNNGELPLHNHLYPNTGFSPSPARQSALVPRFMFRVSHNAVLARCFSSGTEFSESEWAETDDDYVTDNGHCKVPYQDRGRLHVDHERVAYATEAKTDAEAVASTLMEVDEQGDLHHGSQKLGSSCPSAERKQVQQAACATEAETDADEDEHLHHGSEKFGSRYETESEADAGSHHPTPKREQVWQLAYANDTQPEAHSVGSTSSEDECLDHRRQEYGSRPEKESEMDVGSGRLSADWQAAYATESETDEGTVSDGDQQVHHGRQKFGLRHQNLVETHTNDRLHGGRRNSGSRHPPAKPEQVQRVRQTTAETDLETDMGTETDENENLVNEKLTLDPKEDKVSDAEGGASDWQETDDVKHAQEQRQGDDESESEVSELGISDWADTEVDEPLRLWKDVYGDTDGDDAGSINLSRGPDRSLSGGRTSERQSKKERSAGLSPRTMKSYDSDDVKTSGTDRSHRGGRAPERPSKKERTSGLCPRTIRDDDSDEVEIESDLEGELQEEIERQMAAEPKFERPSVTWGILLTKDLREEARETVLKYLETEGIDTSELTRIELPSTVDVMQTRLGFLRKIGLDNEAINSYPLTLGCSVSKNMVPVLKYLKKLGFPQDWVPMLLKKYPMVLHASVVIDILPVIYFLRGLDIDAVDLPRVILKYPDVLGFKTDGTMSTSVAYLVSMGVNLRHVGNMLTEHPEILGMRVASVIKPKFEYLMSLGIPQLIVAKILTRRPELLDYDLEKRMQSNVNQLLEVGVRKEAIAGMVAQFPEILVRVYGPSLEVHVHWFKEHLELDTDGVARMIEKMPQVIFMPIMMARERIRFLKSERFTNAEVGSMVSKCPQILGSSIRDNLRPNLSFLMRQMKRSRTEVLDFPAFFTYSLRDRIRPRFEALTNRDAHCSLDWLLNCSDLEFQKRLKAGFVGYEGVGLEFFMGGRLQRKPAPDESESQSSEQCKVAAM